ncbi:hypothetical protein LY90DRAFT_262152 [Neocallimastix californiae]|uniref:Uncharacterized protein n=1 Tax=Neocallimastix californiae TaxID=1754190 RepID=A0A1Y2DBI4_9FUNG|nr:hypothetical protein LY90DRAFT_262152 [Neocallimastix californiae]|eukprot:ORY56025.1 hypothetical protein LY90DRAFT_262152 [Neocallimastix californiae]
MYSSVYLLLQCQLLNNILYIIFIIAMSLINNILKLNLSKTTAKLTLTGKNINFMKNDDERKIVYYLLFIIFLKKINNKSELIYCGR